MSQEKWTQIRILLQKIDDVRAEAEEALSIAYSQHKEHLLEMDPQKWSEILKLYRATLKATTTEQQCLEEGTMELRKLIRSLQEIKVGSLVAAKKHVDGTGIAWIWARVLNLCNQQYDLEDVEDKSMLLKWSEKDIIPVPYEGTFSKGDQVFALYPDTTAFYSGTVTDALSEEYVIAFVDDPSGEKRVPKSQVTLFCADKINS